MAMMRPRQLASLKKIRVGNLGDGGYVMPDDFDGLQAVLSIGVGHDVSFDHYFAERGLQVYQYDHTLDGPPASHSNFRFNKLGWGHENTDNMRNLAGMLADNALASSFDLLLKFDIEGGEWGALHACDEALLAQFRVITFELHSLCLLDVPGNLDLFLARLAVLTAGHTPIHLHANNWAGYQIIQGVPVPDVVELTLLRNDRDRFVPSTDPIPGPLDVPNAPGRPDIVLRMF